MQISQDVAAPDFRPLLQPAKDHQSPAAVLADTQLSTDEKRSILSSWASDFYTVESVPSLREIPGVKRAISLNDILCALRSLDDDDPSPRGGIAMQIACSRLG